MTGTLKRPPDQMPETAAPQGEPEGVPPDTSNEFVTPLVEWFIDGMDETFHIRYQLDKPQADASTLSRHSAAGDCLKKVALHRDGVPTQQMDGAGISVTAYGTVIHEMWQQALERKWPGRFEFEAPSTLAWLSSGHADAIDREAGHLLELKTAGGTKFKKYVGADRYGPATGPGLGNLIQLGLNARGLGADKATIIVLAMEGISGGLAATKNITEVNRFGAQWTFDVADLDPLVDQWLGYLEFVRDRPTAKVGRWVMGEMPLKARLNPISGNWTLVVDGKQVDTGSVWGGQMCEYYCDVSEECRRLFKQEVGA